MSILPVTPLDIADYALISDCSSAALVGNNGSIDWLCWPRFDSGACFAALLGTSDNGRWQIAPVEVPARVTRSYREGTMVLETLFETAGGAVALIDFMHVDGDDSSVVRVVEGRLGTVAMHLDLVIRFDYGVSVPWVERLDDDAGLSAIVGPNRVVLRTAVPLVGQDLATIADFTVAAGERVEFVLTYRDSDRALPPVVDPSQALDATLVAWRDWSGLSSYHGQWQAAVERSLLTLKALTYARTGAIVAAPTTSLPEELGGSRNWDYRYCWLRDASLTLTALMQVGHVEEAQAWRDWLHRAVAGSPEQMQIMYGIGGERRLDEYQLPGLPGYQGASPVRIGNAAAGQLQLDIFGEVVIAFHETRVLGLAEPSSAWPLQRAIIEHLETIWHEPDEGVWEIRGARRHFTFSKIMAWVAFDRSIRDAETFGLDAPLDRWRAVRDEIHATICAQGFDAALNSFTQSFGSPELDASLLLIARTGFLPPDDPRFAGTVAAVERDLLADGFVQRYHSSSGVDGLPSGEGVFLPCSFWLVDVYTLQGRHDEARRLFERLLDLANDVGLLSEEYDVRARRQVGNFPQAFSHLALIHSAILLDAASHGPAQAERIAPIAAA